MKSSSSKGFFAGILLALTAAGASAVPLAPGDSVFLPGTTVLAQPELAGLVINDNTLAGGFVSTPTGQNIFAVSFDLQNRVAVSNVDDTLIFSPRILPTFNNASPFQVTSIELMGFGSFTTDVNYRTDGLGDRGPTFADRSADGDTLTLDFGFPLLHSHLAAGPHEESYFITIKTAATAFANTGSASVFGTSLAAPGEIFRLDYTGLAVPVSADIPLPSTLLLFVSAVGLGFTARRRQLS